LANSTTASGGSKICDALALRGVAEAALPNPIAKAETRMR
jgi:hypothetical protein